MLVSFVRDVTPLTWAGGDSSGLFSRCSVCSDVTWRSSCGSSRMRLLATSSVCRFKCLISAKHQTPAWSSTHMNTMSYVVRCATQIVVHLNRTSRYLDEFVAPDVETLQWFKVTNLWRQVRDFIRADVLKQQHFTRLQTFQIRALNGGAVNWAHRACRTINWWRSKLIRCTCTEHNVPPSMYM